MQIKISTDSTADIPKELTDKYDISVLPLTIHSGDIEWVDGITITPQEFYQVLEQVETLPTSAAIPPSMYSEYFEKMWSAGYSDIIHIALNSKGSSTYQNGLMARRDFYETHPETEKRFRIHMIDSLSYSMGYGIVVLEAARLAQNGADVSTLLSFIRDWLENARPTFVPLNLKYVKKSGRISAAAAFVGDVIGLKPVIRFEEGEARIISKIRGEQRAIKEVLEICKSEIKPGTAYAIVTGNNEKANDDFRAAVQQAVGWEPLLSYTVGCVISINTGPDMFGIIYRK
ncbi:MAG: DegV family protein [Eubacteriales bacterium]|nr:DegV family protein [Eubacteriales bacterium]